jgi:lipoprotein NlpD
VKRASAWLCCAAAASLSLAGCSSRQVQAPVIERAPPSASKPAAPPVAAVADTRPETYTVKRGDTLFSIALDQGHDYKDLAAWNNLDNPNLIRPGQQLRLKPSAGTQEAQVKVSPVAGASRVESRPIAVPPGQKAEAAPRPPAAQEGVKSEPLARKLPYSPENVALLQRGDALPKPAPVPAEPAAAPAPKQEPAAKTDADIDDEDKVEWGWPATGKILAGFSEATNKGMDIAGKPGDPVIASGPGRVVYSGSGLRGYGKLVIIKHNKTYLSAYAHNKDILVKEGQSVVKGQKIAEIGSTDTDAPKLHFEIRKLGKPVDPAKFLPPS